MPDVFDALDSEARAHSGDADSSTEKHDVVPAGRSCVYSANRAYRSSREWFIKFLRNLNYESTFWLQQTGRGSERPHRIRDVLQNMVRVDEVERS